MGCNLSGPKSEGWNEVKVKRTNNRTKVLPLDSVKQTKLQKWAEAKAKRNQDSSLFPVPEHVAVEQWRTHMSSDSLRLLLFLNLVKLCNVMAVHTRQWATYQDIGN